MAGLLDNELVAIPKAGKAKAIGQLGAGDGQLALKEIESGGNGIGAFYLERGGEGGGLVGEFAGVSDFMHDDRAGFGWSGRRSRGNPGAEGENEKRGEGSDIFHNFKKAWPILSCSKPDASEKQSGNGGIMTLNGREQRVVSSRQLLAIIRAGMLQQIALS